jgi:putative hydrolase of the HAD superfamily
MSETFIKAVYFDVGGPLVDDTAIDDYWIEYLQTSLPDYIRRPVRREEIDDVYQKVIFSYAPKTYSAMIWHFVRPDRDLYRKILKEFYSLDFVQFYKLRPDAVDVCKKLAQDFTLAIAANQFRPTAKYLSDAGVLQHFTYKKMSQDMPYSKPDQRFFMYIADKLRIPLEQSVMVGDRQDNDIIPAKMMGMKTIRFSCGLHQDQEIRLPTELPDKLIKSLKELPSAINDLQNHNC